MSVIRSITAEQAARWNVVPWYRRASLVIGVALLGMSFAAIALVPVALLIGHGLWRWALAISWLVGVGITISVMAEIHRLIERAEKAT